MSGYSTLFAKQWACHEWRAHNTAEPGGPLLALPWVSPDGNYRRPPRLPPPICFSILPIRFEIGGRTLRLRDRIDMPTSTTPIVYDMGIKCNVLWAQFGRINPPFLPRPRRRTGPWWWRGGRGRRARGRRRGWRGCNR